MVKIGGDRVCWAPLPAGVKGLQQSQTPSDSINSTVVTAGELHNGLCISLVKMKGKRERER